MSSVLDRPRLLILLLAAGSAALLGGALLFQYVGGLPPCPMCIWQRWPHGIVIAVGLLGALLVGGRRKAAALTLGLLAVALGVGAGLGLYHAGVEQQWWTGPTGCAGASAPDSLEALREQLMAQTRVVRCDEIPWQLWGISLAGWNAIGSGALALVAAGGAFRAARQEEAGR